MLTATVQAHSTGINWAQWAAVVGVIVTGLGVLGGWLDRSNRHRADQTDQVTREIAASYVGTDAHLALVERVTRLEARQELVVMFLRGEFDGALGRDDP